MKSSAAATLLCVVIFTLMISVKLNISSFQPNRNTFFLVFCGWLFCGPPEARGSTPPPDRSQSLSPLLSQSLSPLLSPPRSLRVDPPRLRSGPGSRLKMTRARIHSASPRVDQPRSRSGLGSSWRCSPTWLRCSEKHQEKILSP